MAALIDTNILVYRLDPRSPDKQRVATEVLRRGVELGNLVVPHQAIVELVAATTRPAVFPDGRRPLLTPAAAHREAEEILRTFPVLYPTEEIVRTAMRGMSTYQLSWFDAHLWAYAECYGLPEILSEDFTHGRYYGAVRVTNPLRQAEEINEPRTPYRR